MTRRRSSYSMPGSSGHDDFRAKQEPQFEPVDDLSQFVADRIREAETEPVADQVEPNGQPMAYRYAKHVRRDMVAFRKILTTYAEHHNDVETGGVIGFVVLAIANRWDDHHDFERGWLIDG